MKMDLQLFAGADDIFLGDGVFKIGTTTVALVRGGGRFAVEREFRQMEADGDMGPVKGRIRKVKAVPKLTMNALELLPANIPKMYPAVQVATSTGVDTITAKADIEDSDYQDTVSFVGKTKAGRGVTITVKNAINLENLDWNIVDKDEIVPQVTYTGTYTEAARTTEPWEIVYAAVS